MAPTLPMGSSLNSGPFVRLQNNAALKLLILVERTLKKGILI